jgi:hypothetical protein
MTRKDTVNVIEGTRKYSAQVSDQWMTRVTDVPGGLRGARLTIFTNISFPDLDVGVEHVDMYYCTRNRRHGALLTSWLSWQYMAKLPGCQGKSDRLAICTSSLGLLHFLRTMSNLGCRRGCWQ